MELHQLQYFVAVAEEGSFTRAAEREQVAQPGVSAQVKRLERELGQDLLLRTGRAVRLTEVGAAVLPHARAALAAVADARATVDEFAGLLRGRVAVGMITNCRVLDLPDILATFHDRHPDVEISLLESESDRLTAMIRAGELDLGLVSPGPDPQGLSIHVVTDERLYAGVAPGHPLAAREEITLTELADWPLISLPPGTGLRGATERALAAAGLRPRIAYEASDPAMLGQLAARGLGVAVLPEVSATHDPTLHALLITEPVLRSRLALAWRDEAPRNPAARALIELAAQRRAYSYSTYSGRGLSAST